MSYMITVHHVGRMMYCYTQEPLTDFRATMIQRQKCASDLYEYIASKYGKDHVKLDNQHDFNPHVPITIWYKDNKEYEVFIVAWHQKNKSEQAHTDYVTQPRLS